MAESTVRKSLLLTVLAGMLGASLALLIAPRSGKETREMIRSKKNEAKKQAKDGVLQIRQSLDQSLKEAHELKQRLAEVLHQTDKAANNMSHAGQEKQQRHPHPVESSILSTWEEEA